MSDQIVPAEIFQCGLCDRKGTQELFTVGLYQGPICKNCHSDFRRYGCD